ncbi:MAG TPA: CoA-acylating methylmalonate-semialdehyde dehydrogenase [Terriglobales bacterium]|nr:CoA-acylating methylmalonate-semialdehyde dehydrogenase [Terriglobales bacterium]
MAPTSAVSADLKTFTSFIDGKPIPASGGHVDTQLNPATGEGAALIAYSSAKDVDAAVDSAHRAFPGWSKTPVLQRSRIMFKFRELVEKHTDDFVALITEEHGKTLDEAKASFQRGLEAIEFACGAPSLMMGEGVESVGVSADSWTIRKPIGVCVGITPFNFPFMVPLWMFPISIACGNTFVLKPSEKVPRSALRLAELMNEAGLPKGVLNVVIGGKEVVDQLLAHPHVVAASFVGSSAVAKYIYSTGAAHGKRVQALGGAKNHSIVMPDADLKSSIDSVIASSYGCAGERCVATSMVVTVGEIGDPFVAALKTAADAIAIGNGTEKGVTMGPLISGEHRKKVLSYIDAGEKEGAVLVRDGRKGAPEGGGNYLGPTIFDKVKPEMKIAREEIFGPVLSVVRTKTLAEALDVVNSSDYGNAASIYTRSGSAAREFTENVQAGMLGINIGVPAPVAIFPFAGWKGSFYGDLHALGKDAVRFYTETKVVTQRWS